MKPNIVAFLCNWCGYAGADLAGVSRYQYPTSIKIIRVMCSGRVDPAFILRAFENGADGVLICGCHINDCHYIAGNVQAEKNVNMTKKLIEAVGINPQRLRLEWISAAEGAKFSKVVTDFTTQLEQLGLRKTKKKDS
ncbi:MAG: hydrogenase iron-sulfur subunit [Candidatus Helarchaeota archaeon]